MSIYYNWPHGFDRPFEPNAYEDELGEDGELMDEEGQSRLKLKVIISIDFIFFYYSHFCNLQFLAAGELADKWAM